MLSHISTVFERYLRGTQFITRRTTRQHTIVLKSAISRSLPVSILKISSSPVSRQLSSMSVWERDDERKEWIMQLLLFSSTRIIAVWPRSRHGRREAGCVPQAYRFADRRRPAERLANLTGFRSLAASWSSHTISRLSVCLRGLWQEADRRVFWCHSILRERWVSHNDEWMRLNGLTDRLYLHQWESFEQCL